MWEMAFVMRWFPDYILKYIHMLHSTHNLIVPPHLTWGVSIQYLHISLFQGRLSRSLLVVYSVWVFLHLVHCKGNMYMWLVKPKYEHNHGQSEQRGIYIHNQEMKDGGNIISMLNTTHFGLFSISGIFFWSQSIYCGWIKTHLPFALTLCVCGFTYVLI